jgi:retinol dehydrogenase-14
LQTKEGNEMTMALNCLAPFLLSNLLFEKIKSSGHGRIINIASAAHQACSKLNFDDIQSKENYHGKQVYAQTKLALLVITYEMARRFAGAGITVNAMDRGNVITSFSRNNGLMSWAKHMAGSYITGGLVGSEKGAQTGVYLAISPDVEGSPDNIIRKIRRSDHQMLLMIEMLLDVSGS